MLKSQMGYYVQSLTTGSLSSVKTFALRNGWNTGIFSIIEEKAG